MKECLKDYAGLYKVKESDVCYGFKQGGKDSCRVCILEKTIEKMVIFMKLYSNSHKTLKNNFFYLFLTDI